MDKSTKRKQNNIAFVSCITGGYDLVKPTIYIDGVDWIMYSDKKETLDEAKYYGWQTKLLRSKIVSYRLKARQLKWLPHKYLPKRYKKALWIDGSVQINNPKIKELFLDNMEKGLRFIIHPARDCIYDEVEECWWYEKYKNTPLREELKSHEENGMPRHYGLWAFTIFGHDLKNEQSRKICEEVNREDKVWHSNDQVAGAYIFWKNNFKPETINIVLSNNEYFSWLPHTRND